MKRCCYYGDGGGGGGDGDGGRGAVERLSTSCSKLLNTNTNYLCMNNNYYAAMDCRREQ